MGDFAESVSAAVFEVGVAALLSDSALEGLVASGSEAVGWQAVKPLVMSSPPSAVHRHSGPRGRRVAAVKWLIMGTVDPVASFSVIAYGSLSNDFPPGISLARMRAVIFHN
jgi:hypothetical protein